MAKISNKTKTYNYVKRNYARIYKSCKSHEETARIIKDAEKDLGYLFDEEQLTKSLEYWKAHLSNEDFL